MLLQVVLFFSSINFVFVVFCVRVRESVSDNISALYFIVCFDVWVSEVHRISAFCRPFFGRPIRGLGNNTFEMESFDCAIRGSWMWHILGALPLLSSTRCRWCVDQLSNQWAMGMSSSIRAGLLWLNESNQCRFEGVLWLHLISTICCYRTLLQLRAGL